MWILIQIVLLEILSKCFNLLTIVNPLVQGFVNPFVLNYSALSQPLQIWVAGMIIMIEHEKTSYCKYPYR